LTSDSREVTLDTAESTSEGCEVPSKVQAFVLSACVLAVVLTYTRLFFGVDLGDEAFHVVVPYRYVLGAQPFVDEVNLTQIGAGLLASPFVAVYYHLVGLDGIILFSRHLYFVFALGITAAVFFSLRALLSSTSLALPISLLTLAFIPQNLPSPNYNSLGNGLFVAGCFLGLAYTRNHRTRYVLLAGLTHGLAVFVYPTLGAAVAVYAAALYFVSSRSRVALGAYVGTTVLAPLAWLVVLLHDGVGTAQGVFELSQSVAEGRDVGVDRGINIVRDTAANFALAPLALAVLVGAVALSRRRPNISVALLGILPMLALPVLPAGGWSGHPRDLTNLSLGGSIHFVANLGLLALPLAYVLRKDEFSRRLMIGVWIPAFVAGVVVSWSTFDSGGHQAIGFSAGAIAAGLLLALMVRRFSQQTSRQRPALTAALFISLVPLAVLVTLQFTRAFHDSSPLRLHSWVGSGPYAGLFTTSENERLLVSLDRDLRRTSKPECTILFYYSFPAGYLMTRSTPDMNTAFLSDREPLRIAYVEHLLRYYGSRGETPDVAVRLVRIPFLSSSGRPRYALGDPLDALVTGPAYEQVLSTASYTIHARRKGSCAPA
jgi:hypothetical protein